MYLEHKQPRFEAFEEMLLDSFAVLFVFLACENNSQEHC